MSSPPLRAMMALLLLVLAAAAVVPASCLVSPPNENTIAYRAYLLIGTDRTEAKSLRQADPKQPELFASLPSVFGFHQFIEDPSPGLIPVEDRLTIGSDFLAVLDPRQRERVVVTFEKIYPRVQQAERLRANMLDHVKDALELGDSLDSAYIDREARGLLKAEAELQEVTVQEMIPVFGDLSPAQLATLRGYRYGTTPVPSTRPALGELHQRLASLADPLERDLFHEFTGELFTWFTGIATSTPLTNPASFFEPYRPGPQDRATFAQLFLDSLDPHARAILDSASEQRYAINRRFSKIQLELSHHFSGRIVKHSGKQPLQASRGYPEPRYRELGALQAEIALLEAATYVALQCAIPESVATCLRTHARASTPLAERTAIAAATCKAAPKPSRIGVKPNRLATGEELVFPEERRSVNGAFTTTLTLDAYVFENSLVRLTTRAYEGAIPGPTLRLRRGDDLHISLVNNLGPQASTGNTSLHNIYSLPNSTNLHTHGLHISGEDPGDSVLVEIHPGETHQYTHEIPPDHAGGTFWYHPHRHGSTFIQVAGGAAGMMLVEDEPGDIPAPVATMPEVICVIQHMKLIGDSRPLDAGSASTPPDLLWKQELKGYVEGTNDDDYNFMMVNGQLSPQYTMTVGHWHRFRMVLAGHSQYVSLTVSNETCDLHLLAKDGIFLSDAPRVVSKIVLAPGNRADVAIRCRVPGSFPIKSTESTPSRALITELVGTLLTLNVVPGPPACKASTSSGLLHAQVPPMAKFQPYRPAYLRDLSVFAATEIPSQFAVTLAANQVNGQSFQAPPYYITSVEVGTIHQWNLTGIAVHPFHLHVNPFQIIGPAELDDGDYFRLGDFYDTFRFPNSPSSQAQIRFQTDIFTGDMIFHCHILPHEDVGMMGCANITGIENTRWRPEEECSVRPPGAPHTSTTASTTSTSTSTSSSDEQSEPEDPRQHPAFFHPHQRTFFTFLVEYVNPLLTFVVLVAILAKIVPGFFSSKKAIDVPLKY